MFLFNCCAFLGFVYVLTNLTSAFCYEDIYQTISASVDSEFVDPNSLYYSHPSQHVQPSSNFKNLHHSRDHGNEIAVKNYDIKSKKYLPYNKDSPYEVFSRRLINMLISKSNLKLTDGIAIGKLHFEATEEQLAMLRDFGSGKVSIRQLDSIIADVIQPIPIDLMDEVLNFADRLSIYLYQHRVIFGGLLLMTFIIIIAFKVKWTRWRIIVLIFDVIVSISFVLTWWELIQESEIKLMAKQVMYSKIPDECKLGQNSYFKSFLLFFGFGRGDCVKYFESIMTDPVLQVTPLQAFNHMCSKLFFYPLTIGAQHLSEFVEIATSSLPFPINYAAKIILVTFIPFFIGILTFLFFGGAIGMRVGPFFHFYLHGRQAAPPENLVAHSDRQAIEVIRSEVRETLPAPDARRSEQNTAQNQKNTPKKVKKDTNTKRVSSEDPEKIEDNDTNSDEFPEEKEYEKISKKRIEDEISQVDDLKIKSGAVSEEDKNENETDKKLC